MLKFFRRIRQKLLSENRFSKYLIYAIGEIVLVVIGILIALNINNKNEYNKLRILEVKILKEIKQNLLIDLEEINTDIELMDSISLAYKDVSLYINSKSKPSKSFAYDIAKVKVTPHFNPNKSGYELMVSKGVEIVLNDNLRADISTLYETTYPYYYSYEEERRRFKENVLYPWLLKYFKWIKDETKYFLQSSYISENDYTKLKKEDINSFSRLIKAAEFENWFVQHRAKETQQKIENLIKFIDEELKKK